MQAVFFDGKTSASHEIDITIRDKNIIGKIRSGKEVLNWTISSLKLLQELSGSRPAILCSTKNDAEARIYINESSVYQALSKKLNDFRSIKKDVISGWKMLLFIGIVVICFLLVPFWIIPTFSEEILNITPSFVTNNLGKSVMGSYLKRYKVIASKDNQIIQKMASKLNSKDINIFVTNDKSINAFALPGKQIILCCGLIDFSDSSNEIAGVLAHEIGHIRAKHPEKRFISNLGGLLLIGGKHNDSLGFITRITQAFVDSAYSRKDENTADVFATKILHEAGVKTTALADFFKRSQKKYENNGISNSKVLSYFSSHPKTGERIKLFQEEGESKEILSVKEWQDFKNICKSVKLK